MSAGRIHEPRTHREGLTFCEICCAANPSAGSQCLMPSCSICGVRAPAPGSPCVFPVLASAAGRLTRAAHEREERRRKAERPFAVWLYVRSDTHVIDHNGDACEIGAAGDTARNLAGPLLTPSAVAEARRTLRNATYSYGNVRAVRVNVYRKGAVR